MSLKDTLKTLKLHESTISMVLGALVIIVAGVLLIRFFEGRQGETLPPLEIGDEATLPTTHTVAEGEDLWNISERYYGTGYNWVDIADTNNIAIADQIEVGQQLTIPDVEPRIAVVPSPTTTPTPLSVQKDGETIHVVSSGESLWGIAEMYYDSGFNWVDIRDANNLENPALIEEGQELVITEVEPKQATVIQPPDPSEAEAISGATYTVQKSDNLWEIAVRAYGDGYRWVDIARENNLANPNLIHPGNVLSLPR